MTTQTCDYCGRGPADTVEVVEPCEDGATYQRVIRTVCPACARHYARAPWGFEER